MIKAYHTLKINCKVEQSPCCWRVYNDPQLFLYYHFLLAQHLCLLVQLVVTTPWVIQPV